MANFLPVLLISVANANSIPDDSSVSTLPRGQVDYLSHNWLEEDVWRSWRKMTRQKNEIANGVRLENASWRTWWKQRNGLKTVTPETLNWLKDSDVTWLYGPLHTAADWAPPAKLKPGIPVLAPSQPDQPRHKPILKHRSICELLTSELPLNSLFTPVDSENENQQIQTEIQTTSDVSDPKSAPSSSTRLKRPALSQTKSDTHITRWNTNHPYRKDSPPRVEPPSASSEGIATSQNEESTDGQSQIRSSYSQDSSSTGASTTGLADNRSSNTRQKGKHISFNTFVEQYIAIDKPNPTEDGPKLWGTKGPDYDDGYEEDEEDDGEDDDEAWDGRTRHPPLGGSAIAGSDSDDDGPSGEGDDDDDDVIEIRPRSYSNVKSTPRKRAPRSPSTSASLSTSSSSRSTSTSSASRSMSPSSSSQGGQAPSAQPSTRTSSRRSSNASTYRPRPRLYPTSYYSSFRSGSEFEYSFPGTKGHPQVHVTIAPIAPTILKTTETGYDTWAEGFGDEGGSDDGLWGGRWGAYSDQGEAWNDRDRRTDDDGTTPVELVYVPPPFVGRYSMGLEDEDFDLDAEEERIEQRKEVSNSRFYTSKPRVTEDAVSTSSKDPSDSSAASTITPPSPNPGLAIESLSQTSPEIRVQNNPSTQAQDVPRAPLNQQELHENLCRRLSSPEQRSSLSPASSRSRSRSRTPSPLVDPPSRERNQNSLNRPQLPVRASSATSLPALSSSPSLLVPPVQRGRGSSSFQDLAARGQQTRGRSSTRTPSQSDCERGSVESPIGSLSPDGSFIRVASVVGGVYATGRTDKERQKEREKREERELCRERGRERERGRDRTGKRLSQSLSPDFESGIVMRDGSSYEGRAGRITSSGRFAGAREATHTNEGTVKAVSSSEDAQSSHIPQASGNASKDEAEEAQRRIQPTPTPSNSPTLTMNVPPAGLVALEADTTPQTTSEPHRLTTHSPKISISQPPTSPTRRHMHTPNSVAPQDLTTSMDNLNVRSPVKVRSPLLVPPPPHPAEPSTSLSISPPGTGSPSPVVPSAQLQGPGSPTTKEPTMVEKAVGMVSSAGAFLGLWHPR